MSFDNNICGAGESRLSAETERPRAILDLAIETYYDDILRAIRRRGADPGQATEIVHDLYIQLSRKPERLQGKASLRAFLIRAAINLGIDRARRWAFEARLFASIDERACAQPATSPSLHARLDRPKRLAALQEAIFSLPPQCRNVFIAHRIAGFSKAQVAEALGIQCDTVDRHLRKALLRCMEKMDEFEDGQS